jgi:hypothetical protein
MSWHVFRLMQNGAELLNLAAFALQSWESNPQEGVGNELARDTIALGANGATFDALAQAVADLNDALRRAELNNDKRKGGRPYTPIFLQVQPVGATYALQTEILGGNARKEGNWLGGLLGNIWNGLKIELMRRAYFEETSVTTLVNAQTFSNNFGAIALSAANLRGDLPFPLYVEVNPGASGDDRVCVFVKADDTPANFVAVAQTDSGAFSGYSVTLGADTANVVDANLANGNGARITPTGTSEAMRVRVTLNANIAANMGYARVWVRCRDNAASTPVYQLRARFFALNGAVYQYGDYLETRKKVGVVGGTAALPLLDLGWGKVCVTDTQGLAPTACGVEIFGKTTAGSPYPTFDIDEIIFAACDEGGRATGLVIATFPTSLAASLRGVVDARDRVPAAYMVDGSGNFKLAGSGRAGGALFGHPRQDQRVYVATLNSAGNLHTHNVNNTVTIKTQFRHKFWRGS